MWRICCLRAPRPDNRRWRSAWRWEQAAARLVRQLLTESVFLGFLSGVLGLFIAYAGLQLLFGALPSSANFIAPKLDATVFVFALVISLATGFLFGAIPAVQGFPRERGGNVEGRGRTMGRSRKGITLANALLVGQVAFSFLLLVTAALFLRSIERAYDIDPASRPHILRSS